MSRPKAARQLGVRSYDDEAVRPAATIQPHGILVVAAADALTIECISDNVEALLGLPALDLCTRPLAALLDAADAQQFVATLREPRLAALNPHELRLVGPNGRCLRAECTVHRRDGGKSIIEFEPCGLLVESPSYSDAQAPIERLTTARDIPALLADAARDVCSISGFDRALIYRFEGGWQSEIVAEATAPGQSPGYLGRRFPAGHFSERMRRLQLRSPLRIVPDSSFTPARLIAFDARAGSIDLSRATLCDVSPVLHDHFALTGSRAMLTISIVIRGRLWGLIACHNDEPRPLRYRKRAACELIGNMLAWQLDSRLERKRLREGARAAEELHPAALAAAPRIFDDLYLEGRNAQLATQIKLHEDVAAALPSRAAVANVILEFAQRQTNAGGSSMETLRGTELLCEAAIGMLAPCAGTRTPAAGTLSGVCAELHAPLVCADATRDGEAAERDACRRLGIASMLVVPITVSERVTIVLKVASALRGAFGDEHIQTLKLAATNLSTALRAAQEFTGLAVAEREQRAYAQRLRALHAIASTTTNKRRDQIDAALHLGLEQLELDWAFLGVIDYAAGEFVIENSVSRDGEHIVEAGARSPLGSTIIGRVVRTKGVRIMQDVSQSDEAPACDGWASYIAAPLFIGGVNYGVIGFTSRDVRGQPFSEADVEFVAVAGELIASAIERGLGRERLEAGEARYRALAEAIPELVCVVDAADALEYVNARWTSYTGLSLEQSRSAGHAGLYDPAQLPLIARGRAAIPPVEHVCEARLRRHDGAYRWHLVRSVPFRDSAGDAGKWLVTATDIEERKAAEAVMADVHEAALAATEAKSRFLATMSHEIRTPMNAVIGMTELLLLTQLSDEQREYIEIVRDSGDSLLRVLNDILDYSKIEAGKLELETVRFDLPSQLESVVELLRTQFGLKGVRVTTSVGADVPAIVAGDPGRLRQVLLNLAGNALKFTPAGGSVHIAVAPAPAAEADPAATIRFTVVDTGIGIAPDLLGRLFAPFSQGDESTTRKYGGTGLGLSICAQLVALMKGRIGVRSVPGKGSTFWFDIPLRAAKNSALKPETRKRAGARAKPVVMRAEKILLVEDNEINTFLALKQLQRIGFIVSAVNNGRQAVEAVQHEHFDLVFMDCHMPEMDGFAATREIRRLEGGGKRHLPIVAMTADARTEDHENCLRAGMDDYVSKPTSLDNLRDVLERWLPTPERRQTNRNGSGRGNPAATLRVERLLELFDGDRGAVITLLSAAAGSIKADFARIENCAAAHEFPAAAEAAHRLKGTSTSIRSPLLGDISAAIERAARGAPQRIPEALLAELRAGVEAVIADVEKHSKLLTSIS